MERGRERESNRGSKDVTFVFDLFVLLRICWNPITCTNS